jgi:hypothetical protein
MQAVPNLPISICDQTHDGDGGVLLVAEVVGANKVFAAAKADQNVVAQMRDQFGLSRDDVRAELKAALEQLHRNELDNISIQRIREEPPGSRQFIATFIFHELREIREGVVWYDLARSDTGPEDVPVLVRNKLRYAVHTQLVKGNDAAEALLKVLQ